MASQAYSTVVPASSGIIADPIPLSSLFRDPALRRAFERVERDLGDAFAVPAPKPAPVQGGAAKALVDA